MTTPPPEELRRVAAFIANLALNGDPNDPRTPGWLDVIVRLEAEADRLDKPRLDAIRIGREVLGDDLDSEPEPVGWNYWGDVEFGRFGEKVIAIVDRIRGGEGK